MVIGKFAIGDKNTKMQMDHEKLTIDKLIHCEWMITNSLLDFVPFRKKNISTIQILTKLRLL